MNIESLMLSSPVVSPPLVLKCQPPVTLVSLFKPAWLLSDFQIEDSGRELLPNALIWYLKVCFMLYGGVSKTKKSLITSDWRPSAQKAVTNPYKGGERGGGGGGWE